MRTSVRQWCRTLLAGYRYWILAFLGACPTLPFVTKRRRCGQIRGRRPEADPRFTFHASRFTVLGSGPSTTQMVADRSPQ